MKIVCFGKDWLSEFILDMGTYRYVRELGCLYFVWRKGFEDRLAEFNRKPE